MFEKLYQLDVSILLWIQEYLRSDVMTPFMKFITHLGDKGFIWIFITVLFLAFYKDKRIGLACSCSLLGSYVVNNLFIKNLVARTRPYEAIGGLINLIGKQSDYSFPSGHTASSFAAATVLFLMLPKKSGIWFLILAILISFSRLYVGVHYPSDVIAGCISGIILAIISIQITKKRSRI